MWSALDVVEVCLQSWQNTTAEDLLEIARGIRRLWHAFEPCWQIPEVIPEGELKEWLADVLFGSRDQLLPMVGSLVSRVRQLALISGVDSDASVVEARLAASLVRICFSCSITQLLCL